MMTIEQWKSLNEDTKMRLLSDVFNSTYLAFTHFDKEPIEDPTILEALRVSTLSDTRISIDIHKEIKLI